MADESGSLVDWARFAQARAELGANFVRILGYFHEDGVKSVAAVEAAMRAASAVEMVIPAHTLKGESRQFGAEALATLAERIEFIARDCIESHDTPDEAVECVVKLRSTFERTIGALQDEASPLVVRGGGTGFGRKPAFGTR